MSFDVQTRDQLETGRFPLVSTHKPKVTTQAIKRGTLLKISTGTVERYASTDTGGIYGIALNDTEQEDGYISVGIAGSFNINSIITDGRTAAQRDTLLLTTKFEDLRKLGIHIESSQVTTESLTDASAPANVTGLTATAGNTKADLSWTNPSDFDLAKILITWTGNGSHTIKDTDTEEYSATGLTNSTEYTFTVKTVDDNGNISTGVTATVTPTT